LPEALWFESRGQLLLIYHGVVACLGFGRRDVADGLQQPAIVEPVDPGQRRGRAPGSIPRRGRSCTVGTDSPTERGRPFWTAWTPDGRRIVATNYRVNSVSVVDLELALSHPEKAEVARIPLSRPDGQPARPKGVAVTPDGRYAVVSAGANTIIASDTNLTGMLHIIDLNAQVQVATVTGVGIDPYGLVIVDAMDGD
jgi:hypothetical protein